MTSESIADKWREDLKERGYEHHISKKREYNKLKIFTRFWKTVLKTTKINPNTENLKIFEFGCGGCKHLIPFALKGVSCVGLDCSKEVLERSKNYISEVSKFSEKTLDIKLIYKDFLKYNDSKEEFDLVFHVGALEHFLDDKERMYALKKMFDLTKPGGYVVSAVPNGVHILRNKMRKFNLGGYGIPEIDYSPELIYKEMKECGGENIKVLPYNLFLYVLFDRSNPIFYPIKKLFYYSTQIIPLSLLPKSFSYKHTGLLIGIAKKPEK